MNVSVMLNDKESGTSSPGSSPEPCASCGRKISDRYYLVTSEGQWHSSCLRCFECQMALETETSCFWKDGNIYCKEDYYKLFVEKRCARCVCTIYSNELVMKVQSMVFHLACFTCAACHCPLHKGDVFGLREDLVYCKTHIDELNMEDHTEEDYSIVYGDENYFFRDSYGEMQDGSPDGIYQSPGPSQKGRPRKRKGQAGSVHDIQIHTMRMATNALELLHRGELTSSMESLVYDSVASPGSVNSMSQRTKRMRTSFKHHQLRSMKSYFAVNQNPDAKDLKQLANKTGLTKRVLQVWFQNARAKWRRNMIRQEVNGNLNDQHQITSVPQIVLENGQQLEELRLLTANSHALTYSEY